jgi:hypothetical protein
VLAVALLKEFLQLGVGRVGGDDGGEAKGGDKVNLVLTLHKEVFISINKYFSFFSFKINTKTTSL